MSEQTLDVPPLEAPAAPPQSERQPRRDWAALAYRYRWLLTAAGLDMNKDIQAVPVGIDQAPNMLLGAMVILPVWFLLYLFRPPGESRDVMTSSRIMTMPCFSVARRSARRNS